MTPRFEDVLRDIDKFLHEGDTSGAACLWNVLTALRGPDTPECGDKDLTAIVRAAAFPRACMDAIPCIGSDRMYHMRLGFEIRSRPPTEVPRVITDGSHFLTHIDKAFYSLGLYR